MGQTAKPFSYNPQNQIPENGQREIYNKALAGMPCSEALKEFGRLGYDFFGITGVYGAHGFPLKGSYKAEAAEPESGPKPVKPRGRRRNLQALAKSATVKSKVYPILAFPDYGVTEYGTVIRLTDSMRLKAGTPLKPEAFKGKMTVRLYSRSEPKGKRCSIPWLLQQVRQTARQERIRKLAVGSV